MWAKSGHERGGGRVCVDGREYRVEGDGHVSDHAGISRDGSSDQLSFRQDGSLEASTHGRGRASNPTGRSRVWRYRSSGTTPTLRADIPPLVSLCTSHSFEVLKIPALHQRGDLPEPQFSRKFWRRGTIIRRLDTFVRVEECGKEVKITKVGEVTG